MLLIDDYILYTIIGCVAAESLLLFILLLAMPKQGWRLLTSRFGKNAILLVYSDDGFVDLLPYKRLSDHILENKNDLKLLNVEKEEKPPLFILKGVNKPVFIAKANKGVALTPKQLEILGTLDPNEIDKKFYGIFSSSLVAYKWLVEARAKMEASRIPWKFLFWLIPFTLILFVGASMLISVLGG